MNEKPHVWVSDSIGWLQDVLGDFGPEGMTQPRCGAHVNGDSAPVLSLDCTIGHLLENPEAAKLLQPLLKYSQQSAAEMGSAIKRMRLRDALRFANRPAELQRSLEERLCAIPNI